MGTNIRGIHHLTTITSDSPKIWDFFTNKLGLHLIKKTALMSRLWTGFFGTESCRTPKIFQNPDFSLKRRDFWVML